MTCSSRKPLLCDVEGLTGADAAEVAEIAVRLAAVQAEKIAQHAPGGRRWQPPVVIHRSRLGRAPGMALARYNGNPIGGRT